MAILGAAVFLFQLWDPRPPLRTMIPALHLPHPQSKRGLSGGRSNTPTAWGGTTPASPPPWGTGQPPNHPATKQSPAWPLGPADPSSIPPGPGESPQPAHCPTPATFPLLHCSRYQHPTHCSGCTGKRGCRCWGPGAPLAGPPAQSRAGAPTCAWVLECTVRGRALFGVSWFLVLGVKGRRLWAQDPNFPAVIQGGTHSL